MKLINYFLSYPVILIIKRLNEFLAELNLVVKRKEREKVNFFLFLRTQKERKSKYMVRRKKKGKRNEK